jgi:hypothetical protein
MEKKQTAVDYLVEELIKQGFFKRLPIIVIQQASQMEKEQIEEAWDEGQECEYQYHINAAPKYNSNTYYNETYGGNNE